MNDVTAFEPACATTEAAILAIHLMDLTSLNDDDHDARIIALCHQARTPVGSGHPRGQGCHRGQLPPRRR
ncbi:hypothetical protein ACK314_05670 [Aeromonas caviae]